jgi:hypothetical protein
MGSMAGLPLSGEPRSVRLVRLGAGHPELPPMPACLGGGAPAHAGSRRSRRPGTQRGARSSVGATRLRWSRANEPRTAGVTAGQEVAVDVVPIRRGSQRARPDPGGRVCPEMGQLLDEVGAQVDGGAQRSASRKAGRWRIALLEDNLRACFVGAFVRARTRSRTMAADRRPYRA